MGITDLMLIYEDVFNPIIVIILVLFTLLSWYEPRSRFFVKVRYFFIIFLPVSFSILLFYLIIPEKPDFWEDIVISSAYLFSFGLVSLSYRNKEIKQVFYDYFLLLFIASLPYLFISPFWNISGHILFVELPILYLIYLNKSIIPLFIIPILMVFNRPIVGAHTWRQSIFTFFFAFLVFGVFLYLKKGHKLSREI